MRPKLLVVYFGEYRTAEACLPTHTFLNDDQYDIHVAFNVWENSNAENTYKDLPTTYRFLDKLTVDKIETRFKELYPEIPIRTKIWFSSFFSPKIKKSPLFQNLENCLLTIDECEKSWGNFDYILLIRPDIKFKNDVNFCHSKISNIGKRKIIFIDDHAQTEDCANDWFFFSSANVIKSFIMDLVSPGKPQADRWFDLIDGNIKIPLGYHQALKQFLILNRYKSLTGLFTKSCDIVRIDTPYSNVGFGFSTLHSTRKPIQLTNHLLAFDLDGTIADTTDIHFDALNAALEKIAGKAFIITQEERHEYEGRPTKEKLQILHDKKGLSRTLYDAISEVKQEYTKEKLENLEIDDRLVRLFTKLHANNSIAVVTNCIRETAEIILRKIGVEHLVDLLVSASDGNYKKPDPDMYIKAMKTLGYDRLRTIAFEDSNLGWQAAINSGANCVRVQSRKDINNQLIDILEVSLPHDSIVVKPFILDLSKLRARKKILVVYFGEFRTFEESVKTHAFLNHIPGVVDVVFSTWSETITQNTFRGRESGGVSIRPNLNKSKVTRDRIQSAFLNAGYDNFIDVSIHELPVQSDRRDAHFIFSYSLSLELAYKKIQSIMDNYDYVFMMRPDLYFPKLERTYVNKNIPDYITHPWQFDEKYSDGELGCNYVPDNQAIGDQFWFGTPSTIRKAMHVILTTKTRDAISDNWHSWLHKSLSDAGLILKNLPMHEDRRTDTQAVHMLDKLGLKLIKNPAQHNTCLPIQVNRFPTFSNEQPIEVYQKNIYFSLGQTHECNEMLYNYNAKQYLKNTVICMDKELIESLTTDVKYFFDANNITLTELESSYTNYLIITLSSEIYENCIDEVNLSNREKKCVLLNTPEQLNMELIERISHGILYRDQCMTRVDPDLSRCIIFPLLLDLR